MRKIYFVLLTLSMLQFGYGQTSIAYISSVYNETAPTGSEGTKGITVKGFTRGGTLQPGTKPTTILDELFGFASQGWSSTSLTEAVFNHDFIEWSISSDEDYKLTIDQINLKVRVTKTDLENFQIFYSSDNFITKSELDEVQTFDTTDETWEITDLNISPESSNKVTFRLYAWNSSKKPSATTTLYFIDFDASIEYPNGSRTVPNAGCVLFGQVSFEGLSYNGKWEGNKKPSASTGSKNVSIKSGTYVINTNIEINNLKISKNASIAINPEGSLTVKGNIISQGNISLNSSSTRYSSLIVQGTVSGETKYSRHVNSNDALDNKGKYKGKNDIISPPLTGQNFEQFISQNGNIKNNGTLYLFGPFDKTIGEFLFWTNSATHDLVAGSGYRVATEDNGNLTFSGHVTTDTVQKQIVRSGSKYAAWNLVGNPYPSYLDTEKFLLTNLSQLAAVRGAIYGYNASTSNSYTPINLATLTKDPGLRITPGQGFFITTEYEEGTVIFTPEMRTIGSNDDFILGRSTSLNNVGFINLKVSNGSENYNTEIYFNEASSRGLDRGYDAAIYGGKAPSFAVYTHLLENHNGEDLAIQSLNFQELGQDVVVPLGINANKGQQIKISIDESILPEGTEVYLEDQLTNKTHLLNSFDYTFTTDAKLNKPGRFFLRFNNTTLSSPEVQASDNLQIYTTSPRQIIIKGILNAATTVAVYDLQGRLVMNAQLDQRKTANTLDMSAFSTGLYIVKLKSSQQEKTQKVILK